MQSLDFTHGAVSFVAGLVAGMMNAIAAGGTLLTFPALIWLGLDSVTANATSTVALWPFVLGGVFGYRREVSLIQRRFLYFVFPSMIGGFAGAALLRLTPARIFDHLVPYLILFATLLFMAKDQLQKKLKVSHPDAHKSNRWFAGAMLFQLSVGVYGGYFGAGIGIFMLSSFTILGMTDIHQMNASKNILAGMINLVAALYFIFHHMVYWPHVGVMAAGAIGGGYFGAGVARKMGRTAVQRLIIATGLLMALSMFLKK